MAGGFLHAMHKSLEYNRGLLRKSNFRNMKDAYQKVSKKTIYQYKKATPHQIQLIREQVIINHKQQVTRAIILITTSVAVSIVIIWFAINWFIR